MSNRFGQPLDVAVQSQSTQAFVLRRVDYKDSDRILTLYTQDHGKISALARGARNSAKRFSGSLEPFVLLEVLLEEPTGVSMRRLLESSPLEAALGLSQDSARLSAASYAVELFRESVPEETPDLRLFDLLHLLLRLLCSVDGPPLRAAVLTFQVKLLGLLGIGMGLDCCNGCGTAVPPGRSAYFHPARGGVVCTACGGGPLVLSADALSAAHAMATSDLNDVSALSPSLSAEQQVDTALLSFMEHHLGKPLMTRSFYEAAVRMQSAKRHSDS